MNRRQFFQTGAMGLVIARERPRWPIGCFNRPWTNWSLDEALAAMKSAGYEQIGLLTPTRDDPFIGPAATTEYLANLQEKINAHGLRAIMGALASRHDIPLADSIRDAQRQIDNAHHLSLRYVLSFGVDKAAEYQHYYRVMANAASYAEEHGIALAMKPHGGASGASEEILRCIEKRSEEHTSELQSPCNLVCRLLLEKKKNTQRTGHGIGTDSHTWPGPLPSPATKLTRNMTISRDPANDSALDSAHGDYVD